MRGFRLLCLLLLGIACTTCSPAQHGTWNRPADGRPAPESAPPLAMPKTVQLHQVAIDSPGRSDVMVGRLRFPTNDSYELRAQAPIGMRLFTVGWNGQDLVADVAGPLQGKLPARRLALDIAHVYLPRSPVGARFTDERAANGALTGRTVLEADGRKLRITYDQYGWWGPAWLPRRIRMEAEKLRVDIRLSGFELDR